MPIPPRADDVTDLLLAWRQGDAGALQRLVPLVYEELRRLAHAQMRGEPPGQVLQTTGLVHEAYLRLIDASRVPWQNRTHFFAIAARLMRRVLVDEARSRAAEKRGGAVHPLPLQDALDASPWRPRELVALDDALTALEQVSERRAKIVELRYFGGLSVEEAAEVLHVSSDTPTRLAPKSSSATSTIRPNSGNGSDDRRSQPECRPAWAGSCGRSHVRHSSRRYRWGSRRFTGRSSS